VRFARSSLLKKLIFVGDEVTSLKSPGILRDKSETPYVVSYFFNRLLTDFELAAVRAGKLFVMA